MAPYREHLSRRPGKRDDLSGVCLQRLFINAAPCSTSPDKGHIEIATIGLMSRQTGVILAEVGFLLILFAGVWLVAAQIPAFKIPTERTIVAGTALALGGLLLIIPTHWGGFGRPS